ncbi:MAG: DEAD/DEAH box helicase [Gammaproteobacteria bacterium]
MTRFPPLLSDTEIPYPVHVYSEADIRRWIGSANLAKGFGYLPAITKLRISPTALHAFVRGRAPRPYQVEILFKGDRIVDFCSCPLGGYCKHVAAVLIAACQRQTQHAIGFPAAPLPDAAKRRRSPVTHWWLDHLRASVARQEDEQAKTTLKPSPEMLVWELGGNLEQGVQIFCYKGRRDRLGRLAGRKAIRWNNFERALQKPPRFVNVDDQTVLMMLWLQKGRHNTGELRLQGAAADESLRRLLATGRCYAGEAHGDPYERTFPDAPLHLGATRSGHIVWQTNPDGSQCPEILTDPPSQRILPLASPWYVDRASGEAGPLEIDCPPFLLAPLLAAPPLSRADQEQVLAIAGRYAPHLRLPAVEATAITIEVAPSPVLTLQTREVQSWAAHRDYPRESNGGAYDLAELAFQYGPVRVKWGKTDEFVITKGGKFFRVERRPADEEAFGERLATTGLARLACEHFAPRSAVPEGALGLARQSEWPGWMLEHLPRLKSEGWTVEYPQGFRHEMLPIESWDLAIEDGGAEGFALDMGILVEGERLALAPLITPLFEQDARWLSPGGLETIGEGEIFPLRLPDGRHAGLTASRIKPIVRLLIDLFDAPGGSMRLSRLDAPRLAELADLPGWDVSGAERARAAAERLLAVTRLPPVDPPPGLALALRPYQCEGLSWLQSLRAAGLGGILADDMGLGKTAQTLAHLLVEKQAGRLDRPALIVLPTSLLYNWRQEAARFTPTLRLLTLQGRGRMERFADIPGHDVILTTYPLLWRDHEALAKIQYHLLVLDEAQFVKNARSQAAEIIRTLDTRHRLCLTGTPLENHLGELWAQFDFLTPGFLGSAEDFTRRWRTPIEKHGDGLRAGLLARRLKPLILRRRKEMVARELPPKTTMLREVMLEGAQRDLYEAVRSAMDEKVRAAVARQGFRRSQIVILDALLKLRQVCCDPRLLPSAAARRVRISAKLDLLMDLLPGLVEDGRRILLFSQFTTMLGLIGETLDHAHLPYLVLTGDTRDRETPIRDFQSGAVPIFLISLKAGGVGLNLTAADTVIHYDPWWNPAVENQATDRAHRIGQDKPVFVYKLIVSGSIEERMLALQEKKAALAASILGAKGMDRAVFSESDLAALLAPLPPVNDHANGKRRHGSP